MDILGRNRYDTLPFFSRVLRFYSYPFRYNICYRLEHLDMEASPNPGLICEACSQKSFHFDSPKY